MDSSQLHSHRAVLFRYALLNTGNDAVAEDVVHETFLAALQAPQNFRQEAALKTWLIGILKHKIADYFRAIERIQPLQYGLDNGEEEPDTALESLIFDETGHWLGTPQQWQQPDYALEQAEFWAIFQLCQQNLPAAHARAFMLREMVGLEFDDICQDMQISQAACRVYLHRARLRLRECLELRWFNHQETL